jgi:DNA modification methylase
MKNRLFYGDNLDVLRRKIADDSVDLCYIDPPFNSKRNYFQIYNNQGTEDPAQAQAFMDTWEWGDEAIAGYEWLIDIEQLQNGKLTEQTVHLIKGLYNVLGGRGSLLAYIVSITLRVVEIHRVLKPTGSFYLHCDPTASHYLKLILDAVFCGQGGEFINEVIWGYSHGGKSKNHFGRKHDVIFFYTKSAKYHFDASEVRVTMKSGKTSFGGRLEKDEDGREYRLVYGTKNKKGETRYYKYYLDEGKIPEDYWTDINSLQASTAERLGYPTQKPEALLERIIKASSNEGDVVLDAYCGCGTTVAVAQRLGRQWIGIDITYTSISLILYRFQKQFPDIWPEVEANILLDGVPRDLASAIALANRKDDKTRKEFEKWAVLTYTRNQGRINDKKGADGGIDGIAYFLIDSNTNGKAIFQVKSGSTKRSDLATLNSDRMREKAEFGILIAMDMPTKPMRDEITAAGKYKHPLLNREDDRLQVVTIAEILAGKRLDLPMARMDAVKSAVAHGDADRQAKLL